MPCPPPVPRSKGIHDYANTTYWDTTNLDHNEVEVETINKQVLCSQGKLNYF